MDEHNNNLQIAYIKKLQNKNFNSSFSIAVDTNVSIKTILNTDCQVVCDKVECTNGKAIVSGKLHLKVTYIDTDNITATIQESQSFSENISDNSLTSECYLNVLNNNANCNILSQDGILKVDCVVTILPILYINLGFNSNLEMDDKCIARKMQLNTKSFSKFINSNFDYTTNFEIKEKVNKILCYNSYFSATYVVAGDNLITVEGKLYSSLVYETQQENECTISETYDVFNVKTDIEVDGIASECELDLNFKTNNLFDQTEIEIEDDASVVTINNKIYVCGIGLKNVEIDVVKDLFSVENEVELSLSNREFISTMEKSNFTETVYNEIVLQKEEPAIDNVISNLNVNCEILNTYIKDGTVHFEGIINSNVLFIDENKSYNKKMVESPFVINTKIECGELKNEKIDLSVIDCKTKVKRGTIIEVEYVLQVNYCHLLQKSEEIVSNINFGKQIDFSMYDYQIFIAKPGEDRWEISKRIKTHPDELAKLNPNLPDIFEGGEKIIIKR